MDEMTPADPQPAPAPREPQSAPPRPTLLHWIREGLRSGFFLPPRVTEGPTPLHVIALLIGTGLLAIGLERLEVSGPARFSVSGWLAPWWTAGASVLVVWTLLWHARRGASAAGPDGLAGWYALWIVGSVPVLVLEQAFGILRARDAIPAALENGLVFAWGTWLAFAAWRIAVPVVLGWRFGLRAPHLATLVVGLAGIHWVMYSHFYESTWYPDDPDGGGPRFSLSQESFEKQQLAWQKAVEALAPQRPAVRDVYGLVFAPYANEDVFLRESTMVADLLARRFDAQGRVLHLANHASTAETLPWATPLNLQRAVEAIAARMDRERDVLVVYLTSHGARNFRLSAAHWPLQVEGLAPADLRRALDVAGIRHRVIAISACYSGGWIAPLASDTSLVMTAADPEHTSYGCGRLSELTFFGRAVFHEQLRSTRSFERAFAAAVPVIRQREQEAGKGDGFSNPQISVGAQIRPALEEVEKRLDAASRP